MADNEHIKLISERAITVEVDDARTASAIAAALRERGLFEDVVPAPASVSASFDPARLAVSEARRILGAAIAETTVTAERSAGAVIELPTVYGGESGPDLEAIAEARKLSPQEVITRHSAATYGVDILGFVPGFAYLSGLDPSLKSDRLGRPRLRVQAGSVGVSGLYTGVYALGGPGGWPIIGRTSFPLVDPDADEPFVLEPGMRVRFVPQ